MKTFTVCRIVWQPVKTEGRYTSFPLINLLGHMLNIYQMCPQGMLRALRTHHSLCHTPCVKAVKASHSLFQI